jgi:hypothetical protein
MSFFYTMNAVKESRDILPLVQNIDNRIITLCETLLLLCYIWLDLLVNLALGLLQTEYLTSGDKCKASRCIS